MTSQDLSLSLLLTKVTHAQHRKRFRASYDRWMEKRETRNTFFSRLNFVHLFDIRSSRTYFGAHVEDKFCSFVHKKS